MTKNMPLHQHPKWVLAILCIWLTLSIFFVQDARAANQVVTNLNNDGGGSLRQAIADVGAGETITFQAGLTGTIILTTEIDITKSLAITGPGADQITVSGNTLRRVFDITNSAGDVSFSGITIANGKESAGAGIRDRSTGTTTLTNVTFSNIVATGEGGGFICRRRRQDNALSGHFFQQYCLR